MMGYRFQACDGAPVTAGASDAAEPGIAGPQGYGVTFPRSRDIYTCQAEVVVHGPGTRVYR